ncbi:MAG: hypothetical protein ACREQ5_01520 [Candidatus Dormibacteria bacterium]
MPGEAVAAGAAGVVSVPGVVLASGEAVAVGGDDDAHAVAVAVAVAGAGEWAADHRTEAHAY